MTPTEVAAFLRNYNIWRRGNLDDQPMPDPRVIGEAIDAAVKMIDRLEVAEKECDDAKAAAENIALKLDYLRSKLETAENAQNDWLRANAPGGWIDSLRIENEALRAEVIHIKEVEFPRKAQAVANGWRGKCERLEAKIAEMERQAPVGKFIRHPSNGLWEQDGYGDNPDAGPLYALPGAKTSPSINEGVRKVTLGFRWESEAQRHIPTIEIEFEPVSPESPNDAKSWQDRGRLAAMLTPEAKP